ncbi:MAG: sugar phosphate isomerase/epimerase, partial [Alphaproteobacteria bacterium]|nr:sugar phosphate isomerase/epimerase [Alphaproteobacteria bacterium]
MSHPIAVSSWSLHHMLGLTYDNGPGASVPAKRRDTFGAPRISLEDVPAALAARGYHRLELCHFHLASQDAGYLKKIRDAFAADNVIIQTLLIDDGDITKAETRPRDMAWIQSWIHSAAVLGAKYARVIAGKSQPSDEALQMSVEGLKVVSELGAKLGVRVVTENWFDLLSGPKEVHYVLDSVGKNLGFLADTGNWHGASKYSDLASIFARAELCHAKASFLAEKKIDEPDFAACLKAAWVAKYQGPFTLIFDSAGEEWDGLEIERRFIEDM